MPSDDGAEYQTGMPRHVKIAIVLLVTPPIGIPAVAIAQNNIVDWTVYDGFILLVIVVAANVIGVTLSTGYLAAHRLKEAVA